MANEKITKALDSVAAMADDVDRLKARIDSLSSSRRDADKPRFGASRSGFAPAALRELDKKHDDERDRLRAAAGDFKWQSPEALAFQRDKLNPLMDRQQKERESLKAKIEAERKANR